MKKALLIIVAILAVGFFIGNAELLRQFTDTVVTGELIPLVVAIVVTVLRYLTQALSYNTAFEAVGLKTGVWPNIVLVLSCLFINTFCLFSGATGVAFIIDDAHRKGAGIGTATSGAILTQIGYFAALLIISIGGMAIMFFAGSANAAFLVGLLLLVGTLAVLCSFFVLGYARPSALYKVFSLVERAARKVLSLFKRTLREGWGDSIADSFADSAKILVGNPMAVVVTVAYATLSAMLNAACLVAVGFAFGYTQILPLIAAFALAAISIQLSPTPQGIGVTEAVVTMILTAYDCPLATSAAIALVYRGIMLWLPFVAGAFMLSQSGFFKDRRSLTEEDRRRDIAWISGTIMGILGLVNIGLVVFSDFLLPYQMLTQFVDLTAFSHLQLMLSLDWLHIAEGVTMIALCIGLILRLRTGWLLSLIWLVMLGGMEMVFGVYQVGIPILAFAVWLFVKRSSFDRSSPWTKLLIDQNLVEEGDGAPFDAAGAEGSTQDTAVDAASGYENAAAGVSEMPEDAGMPVRDREAEA